MTPCRYVSSNVHVFTCQKSVCRMWVQHQFHGLPSTEPSLPAFLAAYNKSFSFPRIPNEFSIKKFLVNHHYQHNLSLFPAPPFHFLFLGSSSQAQCELWPLLSLSVTLFSHVRFLSHSFVVSISWSNSGPKIFTCRHLLRMATIPGRSPVQTDLTQSCYGHCQVALAGTSAIPPCMQKLIFAQLVKKFAPYLKDSRGFIAVRFAVVKVYGFPGCLGRVGLKVPGEWRNLQSEKLLARFEVARKFKSMAEYFLTFRGRVAPPSSRSPKTAFPLYVISHLGSQIRPFRSLATRTVFPESYFCRAG